MTRQAESLAAWVRLDLTPGIGPATARKLLGEFGLPENIFSAAYAALEKHVPAPMARTLASRVEPDIQQQIDQTLDWCSRSSNHLLTLADEGYPKALLDIADPPLLLYAKGRAELLSGSALAIVGSRNASVQGSRNAENFAKTLSQSGLTIVSGLALGIDAAAHQGGLQGAGSTIAVIGTGVDIVYPARNRDLAHRIADAGCLVSEYPLGTPAIASNFPRRNRLISGLSLGVLVVEAAARSGSLITARLGAEQGKEVFAIPGSIHSPLSKGCHLLIKQGAKLVESAHDVLEELRVPRASRATEQDFHVTAAPAPDTMLGALGFDPFDVDSLTARTGLDTATVSARLLELELEGRIERLPGGRYRSIA